MSYRCHLLIEDGLHACEMTKWVEWEHYTDVLQTIAVEIHLFSYRSMLPRMRVIAVYFRLNLCKLCDGPIRLLADNDFTVRCIQVESIAQGCWMVPLNNLYSSSLLDPTQFNREDEFHSSSAVIPSQYNRDSELHSSSPVISSQYNEDSELHSSSPVISSQYNNELHSSSPDPTKLNGNELHNVFQLDPPQFNGDLHNIVNVDQKPFQIDNDLHNISRVEKDRQPPSKDLHNSLNGKHFNPCMSQHYG